ncbi:MAG: HRDC domain-containing protein, partial [Desulfuromonadales bacterium]|nr:HRDC domain-containing protein [Desulfuromonadales bacterium]
LTTSAEVAALALELRGETIIAVDLEADSMHRYRERVCLMQLSTSRRTVLIDPLPGADLAPLAGIFVDPAVRKIFHAADYDLRSLYRDFRLEVRGLFDTMISAQLLGEEKIGLNDVLGKYFGVTLDKRFQRADWSMRPLPPEMIVYAAEDTRHLHRLAELFEAKLLELGRRDWAAEEFSLLEQVRFSEVERGPLCLRLKGAGHLDRRQLGVLEELLQWREREAERRDRPPFQVIGNAILLALAKESPRTATALASVAELPERLRDRHGRELLAAIARGMELPGSDLPVWPKTPRQERDPAVEVRLTALKNWRREKAAALAIDPGVLINNALLELLARENPPTAVQLDGLPGLKSWQRREFGAELLARLRAPA